jgi:hypothetical protein
MKKKLIALGMVCALSLGTLGITASTASAHGPRHHRPHSHSSISIHKDGFSLHIREGRKHHRHRKAHRPGHRHVRRGHHRHPHHR